MVFKGVQAITEASRIALCHDLFHRQVLFTSHSCGSSRMLRGFLYYQCYRQQCIAAVQGNIAHVCLHYVQ